MKKIFLFLLPVIIFTACGSSMDEMKKMKKTADNFYYLLSEQKYDTITQRLLSPVLKKDKEEWKAKLEIIQNKNGKLITYSFGEVTLDYVDSAKEYVAEVEVKVKYKKITTKERLILHRPKKRTNYSIVGYITEIME